MQDAARRRAGLAGLTCACLAVLATGCGGSSRTHAAESHSSNARPTDPGCKKEGIRYTGKTASGVRVCFTLGNDGRTWLELGYLFVHKKGCPGSLWTYDSTPHEGSGPGFLIFVNFCQGTRFQWTARAKGPLPREALAALGPTATDTCRKPGIHYVGKSTKGDLEVCLTLRRDRSALDEAGWIFEPEAGCKDAAVGGISPLDVDAAGHFEDPDTISGRIQGAQALGELSDLFNCPSKTFTWSARRIG